VRWQQLNDWLVLHQPIWQPAPFIEPIPAWVERYPRLAHWVAELTDAECDDSPQLIQKGFPAFCQWAAGKKQLCLPESPDFDHWLAHGVRRHAEVRRYELVRHLFRRPLELWLVLDYAVFLEEQGYRVRLGYFCARSLTPRNLLLDAVRPVNNLSMNYSRGSCQKGKAPGGAFPDFIYLYTGS